MGQRSESDELEQSTRRRRAARACDFCRQRKMKCGNESPQCTNCKLYHKECQYTELPKKARPSRARLASLEQENRKLQAQLHSSLASPEPSASGDMSPSAGPQSVDTGQLSPSPNQINDATHARQAFPSASRAGKIQVAQSSYYGRTSALFDEDRPRNLRGISSNAGVLSESTKKQLMGEAAYQRQLEIINYNSGKLDFDGVDPEMGMHLLSLHWNRQHHSYLITYRPAFMRDMACQGPYFSKLLLNAIYFGASKFSPRPEVRRDLKAAGAPFRQRVRDLLGNALDRSEITTIQALLVMTSSLFALGDERSAAWTYAGIAFRMLVDLGLHVDDQISATMLKLTDEDVEIRRRVFWGAFVVDKIQSLYQGRPVSLQDSDVRVRRIFQDHYEEFEHWIPVAYSGTQDYPGSPAYSVSTFQELCKLSVIMNSILNKVYGVKSAKKAPKRLAEDLTSMHSDLENWQNDLGVHLQFDPSSMAVVAPPPHVLSLHAMFNVLLILLHRPFVSEGHLHSISPSIPANSFGVCTLAASKIVQLLRIYDRAFSIRHAPYLISYATYVSATIHVRIAAQMGPGSEAYASLRTCLSVFNKNQETNWAARRAQTVIVNLMRKLNIELPEDTARRTYDADQSQRGTDTPNQTRNASDLATSMSGGGVSDSITTPLFTDSGTFQTPNVPDLDMSAIISSFLSSQQPNLTNSQPYSGPQELSFTAENLPHNLPSHGLRTEYDASTWDVMDMPVDGALTPDDMLFGFNGAALDGVW